VDVLSDTLRVVRLAGALFFTARFSPPWSVQSPSSEGFARLLNAQADSITVFHMIVSGGCWIAFDGQPAFPVAAGDVVIFPHADAHIMYSHPEVPPTSNMTLQLLNHLQSVPPHEGIPRIDYSSEGEAVHFVCGYLLCDQRFNPLIGSLPKFLLVCIDRDGEPKRVVEGLPPWNVVHAEAGDWLDTTLRYTIQETNGERAGSSAMLPRLTELLFVELLRRYMQQLPPEYTSWLAAVRDPVVGSTLRLMHSYPERPWTVEELAHSVAVSRSALAQRFTTLVGESPMQYLQGWRMQLAQYLLGQTNLSIIDIADRTGYQSAAAFNRTFKRLVGQPPATWRQRSM
jgi:AraC family transcriptional regulator, alkane utilization regulator